MPVLNPPLKVAEVLSSPLRVLEEGVVLAVGAVHVPLPQEGWVSRQVLKRTGCYWGVPDEKLVQMYCIMHSSDM
jgi:hypothetical protein